jgi:hypothetical protein
VARLQRDAIPDVDMIDDYHARERLRHKVACLLRVLAFLLLVSGWQVTSRAQRRTRSRDDQSAFQSIVRLEKVASKTSKACLEQNETELCETVFGQAGALAEELGSMTLRNEDDLRLSRRLRAEYFVLRTAHVSSLTTW